MRHDNGDFGAVAANPPELFDDGEVDVRLAAEVFQHMAQQHRSDTVVRPWPGRGLQIDHLVGFAFGELVDIAMAVQLLIAASKIQFHRSGPRL